MNHASAEQLLNYASARGIINIPYVQEALDMSIKEHYIQAHPYKVWQGSNGSWYTYLPDETKGRVLKRRSTREALENDIIFYWQNQVDNPTVKDLFEEWNNRRLELGKISNSSFSRYRRDFDRYYISIEEVHIKDLSPAEVEGFLEEQICKYNLTAKAFSNLKTITKGMLKYAKKKGLIDFSVTEIFDDMDMSDRNFRKVIKEDYEEVFDEEETARVLLYLESNLDIQNIGILLLFITGIRIGELVALKHDDFDGNAVKIRRTETFHTDDDGRIIYEITDYPKTKAGVRTAVIPRDYTWLADLIQETNPTEDYIFWNRGKRLTTNSIRRRLERVCKELNIYHKSPHKIRKTYGSILLDNNVDKRLITELMGHSDISVTESHYHRNRRSIDAKIDRISEISDFSTN